MPASKDIALSPNLTLTLHNQGNARFYEGDVVDDITAAIGGERLGLVAGNGVRKLGLWRWARLAVPSSEALFSEKSRFSPVAKSGESYTITCRFGDSHGAFSMWSTHQLTVDVARRTLTISYSGGSDSSH